MIRWATILVKDFISKNIHDMKYTFIFISFHSNFVLYFPLSDRLYHASDYNDAIYIIFCSPFIYIVPCRAQPSCIPQRPLRADVEDRKSEQKNAVFCKKESPKIHTEPDESSSNTPKTTSLYVNLVL